MRDLFEIVLKVTLLVGAALVARTLLRAHSAAFRHWVLTSALVASLLVPLLALVVPAWLPGAVASRGGVGARDRSARADEAAVRFDVAAGAPPVQPRAPEPEPDISSQRRSRAWTLTVVVWASGALTMSVAVLLGLFRLRRFEGNARRLTTGPWVEVVASMSIGPAPELLVSNQSSLLATWGFLRPRVLLPVEAEAWPLDRVRLVLAHELAHVRRADWLAQMLAELARCVYWFHPLVWLACRRLRRESECACDDAVLASGVDGAQYASELVDLARAAKLNGPAWLPAPAMARTSDLEGRVMAMLNANVSRTPLTLGGRALVVAAIGALVLPLAGAVLLAQTYSTFTGMTRDELNTPISSVTLTLSNAGSGQKYEVKSNSVGAFEFVGLPNGDYELQSLRVGFRTETRPIQIVGRNLQRDIAMRIGSVEEMISVRASVTAPADTGGGPSPRPRVAVPPAGECIASPISGKILPPVKIADAPPRYPDHLRQLGTGGVVVLDALIATDGTVKEATSADPSMHPDLVAAAADAVRQWQFTPTLLNCTAVEVGMKVTVRFSTEP